MKKSLKHFSETLQHIDVERLAYNQIEVDIDAVINEFLHQLASDMKKIVYEYSGPLAKYCFGANTEKYKETYRFIEYDLVECLSRYEETMMSKVTARFVTKFKMSMPQLFKSEDNCDSFKEIKAKLDSLGQKSKNIVENNLKPHVSRSISQINSLRRIESIPTHFPHGNGNISKVIFLQDEAKFLTLYSQKTMMVWDAIKHKPLRRLQGHYSDILEFLELQDGTLASSSKDDTVKIWNIHTGECERIIPNACVAMVETSNQKLVTGSHKDPMIKFWDIQPEAVSSDPFISINNENPCWVLILLEDNQLAAGSGNNINIFDFYKQNTPVKILEGHSNTIRSLLYQRGKSPKLISGGKDKLVKIWNIKEGACLQTLSGHSHTINRVFFWNPEVLVTSSFDGIAMFWSCGDEDPLYCLRTVETGRSIRMINSDGVMVTACRDDKFAIWY